MDKSVGIIDSHAHLTWESFAEDQKDVIARAFAENVVQIVHAGVDLVTIPEMMRLADEYEQIYLGIGLHPHEAKLFDEQTENTLRQAAKHKKVVAIGECGLDFYYNLSERDAQIKAFRAQIRLANELNLPLILHTRDAWEDTFAILKEEGAKRGVFHCFTGGPEVLPQIAELDFYVSFSGILTFSSAKEIQKAAALVADNRMLVETDCPYLAPQPMRGKRNEPSYVWYTAEKLANLRGRNVEDIAKITTKNTRELFKLADAMVSNSPN
jgi:TatD DNase family protein